jgi:hypothetical protein
MIKSRSQGRMIRIDIAEDDGLSKLSDGATRLYFMLKPHLNSHGKFSGGPHVIRENVVPLLPWSAKRINGYLVEINTHTSVRVWKQFGRFYVHDLAFSSEQDLRDDRKGRDSLPAYPGADRMKAGTSKYSLPELLPDQFPDLLRREVEVEGEFKEKKKEKLKSALPSPPSGGGRFAALQKNNGDNGNSTSSGNGNSDGLPDYVASDIDRLSEEARNTVQILESDYKAGIIDREEAVATAARLKIPQKSIDALFSVRVGGTKVGVVELR